jgi:outer membrane protein assembly factor BamB
MAGLAANDQCVLVADRDPLDTQDIFRALHADTGEPLWTLRDAASGQLDYGNAPRATPLIAGELAFFYNAFGKLHCVRWATGEIVWKRDLHAEFNANDRGNAWGSTSSPLIADGRLIINPGGPDASIVALRPESGEVIWKTPGDKAAFGSLIVATFGGRRQLVGHDKNALCGWDLATGEQLWRLIPPNKSDFNVGTPIAIGETLAVATENNGTRLYRFDSQGLIVPEPAAVNKELAPDTHTPVAVGGRLFGVWQGLYCLDLQNGLKTIWRADDKAFDDHATALAAGQRVLIISKFGELLLVDAAADRYRLISRLAVFNDDPGVYSHPAIVGKRMYLRGSEEIVCLDLDPAAK